MIKLPYLPNNVSGKLGFLINTHDSCMRQINNGEVYVSPLNLNSFNNCDSSG